ncbi:MAG: phosphoserine transaminase [Alphaproteobacteria bacterium]|nr:phosphoserine transaminase [Alphaproteobacteria bacterium]
MAETPPPSPQRPDRRPADPRFSSGPCVKRPGWNPQALDVLSAETAGRSHRSPAGREQLAQVIKKSRALLELPESHLLAIIPASDTGAMEAALWSLLGSRGIDVLAWETFGMDWLTDIRDQLKLTDLRALTAEYGSLPDLEEVDFSRDVVFPWNGTASGVCVPGGEWIAEDRQGLTICDATSAAFAMDLPWDRLDVATYSWQKVMGGEAQHGILILGPRAVQRLESHIPPWPLPKIFQLTVDGRLNQALFAGDIINTPSMLAVADALDGLDWALSLGGLSTLMERCRDNFDLIAQWVVNSDWAGFVAEDPATRSITSVCLKITAPWFLDLDPSQQAAVTERMTALLEEEKAGYDLGAYRKSPPGLRIWAGATVEKENISALLPWLDWAYATVKSETPHPE